MEEVALDLGVGMQELLYDLYFFPVNLLSQ